MACLPLPLPCSAPPFTTCFCVAVLPFHRPAVGATCSGCIFWVNLDTCLPLFSLPYRSTWNFCRAGRSGLPALPATCLPTLVSFCSFSACSCLPPVHHRTTVLHFWVFCHADAIFYLGKLHYLHWAYRFRSAIGDAFSPFYRSGTTVLPLPLNAPYRVVLLPPPARLQISATTCRCTLLPAPAVFCHLPTWVFYLLPFTLHGVGTMPPSFLEVPACVTCLLPGPATYGGCSAPGFTTTILPLFIWVVCSAFYLPVRLLFVLPLPLHRVLPPRFTCDRAVYLPLPPASDRLPPAVRCLPAF